MLLYFFLVLVADRDGLSFYNYDKICQHLQLEVDDYIQARNRLLRKELIAFDGNRFQLLTLPQASAPPTPPPKRLTRDEKDAQALAAIFSRLAQSPDHNTSAYDNH